MKYLVNEWCNGGPRVLFYSEKWRWVPLLLLIKWALPKTRWVWSGWSSPTLFTVETEGTLTDYPTQHFNKKQGTL